MARAVLMVVIHSHFYLYDVGPGSYFGNQESKNKNNIVKYSALLGLNSHL